MQLQPISILQVKEQIANLEVKCENYPIGCDWKGLFKELTVYPTILYRALLYTLHFIATLTRVPVCHKGVQPWMWPTSGIDQNG